MIRTEWKVINYASRIVAWTTGRVEVILPAENIAKLINGGKIVGSVSDVKYGMCCSYT